MSRIDRLAAATEAAGILLKAQGRELPQPVAMAYYAAGQAWATLAVALGDDAVEIDLSGLDQPEWSQR